MREHFLYAGGGNPDCWYAIREMMLTGDKLTVTPHPERVKSLIEEGGTQYAAVLIDMDGSAGIKRLMDGEELVAWVVNRGLRAGLVTNKPQMEVAGLAEQLGVPIFYRQDKPSYPSMFERILTKGQVIC